MYSIYKIINTVNSKVYIGYTKKDPKIRLTEHIKSSERNNKTIFQKAIRKYGANNFVIETIDTQFNKENALIAEKYHIKNCNSFFEKNGYNMTPGGEGGNTSSFWSEETRRNINIRNTKWAAQQKGKTYEELYGIEKSVAIKKKISGATRGRKCSQSEIEQRRLHMILNNPMKGKHHTKEQRDRISKTLRAKKINIGSRNGMNTHPEARLKIGKHNCKIHHLKNLKTYEEIHVENITQWALSQNLSASTVLVYFSKGKSINDWIRLKSYKKFDRVKREQLKEIP